MEETVYAEGKRALNREFLNRVDEVILSTPLADEDLLKIIDLMVEQIDLNLAAKQIRIRPLPDPVKYILDKTLTGRGYGARARSGSRIGADGDFSRALLSWYK